MKELTITLIHHVSEQPQYVLVRESEAFFVTLAKHLLAFLNEDAQGMDAAMRTLFNGGWTEYVTSLDALRLTEPRSRMDRPVHRYFP